MFYFLPTCRTANIDDDLLGKVQPFATGFAGLDSVRSPAVNLQEPVHAELFTHGGRAWGSRWWELEAPGGVTPEARNSETVVNLLQSAFCVVLWKKCVRVIEELFTAVSHQCNLCSEMCVN